MFLWCHPRILIHSTPVKAGIQRSSYFSRARACAATTNYYPEKRSILRYSVCSQRSRKGRPCSCASFRHPVENTLCGSCAHLRYSGLFYGIIIGSSCASSGFREIQRMRVDSNLRLRGGDGVNENAEIM